MADKDNNLSHHCQFFLPKKRRFCRFQPKKGRQYCPEHECIVGVQTDRVRIPCPLNPSHNCYKDELDKHLKKCNVTKLQQATANQAFYVKGINRDPSYFPEQEAGQKGDERVCVKDLSSADLSTMLAKIEQVYETYTEKVTRAFFEHQCVREELCSSGQENLEQLVEGQTALRKELLQQASIVGQLEKLGVLKEGYAFVELGAGRGKLSHWIERANQHCTSNSYILVDRSSVRYKMDSYHKQGERSCFQRLKIDIEDLWLGGVNELAKNSEKAVVIVGKHLCGGATDLGLRCSVNTLGAVPAGGGVGQGLTLGGTKAEDLTCHVAHREHPSHHVIKEHPLHVTQEQHSSHVTQGHPLSDDTAGQSPSHVESPSLVQPSSPEHTQKQQSLSSDEASVGVTEFSATSVARTEPGFLHSPRLPKCILIALCCHHRCSWDTYVGKDFITRTCGFSLGEFDLLTRLSSWAVCDRKTDCTGMHPKRRKRKAESGDMSTAVINSHSMDLQEEETEDLVKLESSSSLRENLTIGQREEIGRKCKRIIDTGRLHYLRTVGLTCQLQEYISEDVTPENVVLIASVSQSLLSQ